MSDANRVQIAYIEEVTAGTTPAYDAAKFRSVRITADTLQHSITNITSEELRSDRNTADTVQVGAQNQGDISFEMSFPDYRTFFYDWLSAALFTNWVLMAERYNEASDDVITQVTAATDTFACTDTGANFAEGHLVRASGFTNAGNNQLFRAQATSSGTAVVAPASPGLTEEAAPPAGARLKVVGFQGASADITATAGGLGSTLLDFTTLGLSVGQWIKIGGSAAGDKFATAVCNAWARITVIAANALTLDNKPAGWTTDAGTGKTIIVWTGDYARNGTTQRSFSLEKGYMDHSPADYLMFTGVVPNGFTLNFAAEQILKGTLPIIGTLHSSGTSAFGAPAAASDAEVMNAVSNVGRFAVDGTVVAGPNFIKSLSLTVVNNLRGRTAIGTLGFASIGAGRADVTGQMETYFGDLTLYQKYADGLESAVNIRVEKTSQAVVFTMPRIKFESGQSPTPGINQDVMVTLGYRALLDSVTNCEIQIDRFEEYA